MNSTRTLSIVKKNKKTQIRLDHLENVELFDRYEKPDHYKNPDLDHHYGIVPHDERALKKALLNDGKEGKVTL